MTIMDPILNRERGLAVVHVLDKNRFDTGSVHQMFQAASGLARRGHRVSIVSRDDSNLAARAREHGIRFVAAPFASDVDVRTIAILRRVIAEERADVVHVHKGRPHTLALASVWRRPLGAFVVNRGVSFPLTVWNRAKYRSRRVDRVVTVCEAVRRVVMRSGRLPADKVEVVYAGTDTERFDPALWKREEFRAEKAIPLDAFLIVQVGVREWKGWRELIEAFEQVRATEPRAHLALVAARTTVDVEMIDAFAREKGLQTAVCAVEVREDMPRVIAAADCVVDASWSGTGITGTIREAMAMARPVVATDVGGNRELVSSDDVGSLVPPRDPSAMARAIESVIHHQDRAREIGRRARALVCSGFSMEARIDRLEDLYRRILHERQARS